MPNLRLRWNNRGPERQAVNFGMRKLTTMMAVAAVFRTHPGVAQTASTPPPPHPTSCTSTARAPDNDGNMGSLCLDKAVLAHRHEGGAHWVPQHQPWPPSTSKPIRMACTPEHNAVTGTSKEGVHFKER